MSSRSITFGRKFDMKPTWVAIQGVPEGESGASRLVRLKTEAPPCQSSTPARLPWRCTASVISAWLWISDLSQSRAIGSGLSSEVGWIEQAPVQTTPQPPSALVSRNLARTRGRALVMPLAWGTW